MKDRKSRSIPLCVFEYLISLVAGSLIAAAIIRNSYGEGPLFVMVIVMPICLGGLLILYTFHYFWRFFRDEFGGFLFRSLGLAIISTILSVPLCLFFIKTFWPHYNYGPGP
jgi:ABC-type spermidine/putrescine transport system permease subunit II